MSRFFDDLPNGPTMWRKFADEYEASAEFTDDAIEYLTVSKTKLPAELVEMARDHYRDSWTFVTVVEDRMTDAEMGWTA